MQEVKTYWPWMKAIAYTPTVMASPDDYTADDPARALLKRLHAAKKINLKWASEQIGKNHAYLQQFVNRGVPRHLPEIQRRKLATVLGVPEAALRPPSMTDGLTYVPFPDEDPDWRPQPDNHIVARAYDREHYAPKVAGALPELDVSTGAGEGRVGETVALQIGTESWSGHAVVAGLMPADYLRNEVRVAPNRTIVLPVVGDSMIPTYQPGDRVLVDLTQNRLGPDTVYVISDGLSPPQIKRLTRVLFSDPVMVRVISDNAAHGEQTVELDRLTIIGRVCGVVARR